VLLSHDYREARPPSVGLTEFVSNPYRSGTLSARLRARRRQALLETFPDISQMRVLDLGGLPRDWRDLRPAELVVLNLVVDEPCEPWMRVVEADGCDPPDLGRFDLVYCNSVIEHVGGHRRREQLADTVHQLADRHWVQTPYRYFPIEQHFLFPGLQFLPRGAQARLARRWPIGAYRGLSGHAVAVREVLKVDLLSVTEMRYYFPSSELRRERVCGLTKSLVAVRT
jgi:hypothetical protein